MPNAAAWLAAANPFDTPRDADAALRKGRCASVALGLAAFTSTLSTFWNILFPTDIAAAMQQVGVQSEALSEAARTQATGQSLIWLAVILAVYLGLAVIQWRRPTTVIPIIFLALSVLGLGIAILGRLYMPEMAAAFEVGPAWLDVWTWTDQAVSTILLISGWRGASIWRSEYAPDPRR